MIDHLSFSVHHYQESLKFYDETLKILGIEKLMAFEHGEQSIAGYGKDGKAFFWIAEDKDSKNPETIGKARGFHIAFLAPTVESIQEWHKKCLELGAKDNGKPGPRAEYHPGYYGAFVVDINGWRLEAVLHHNKP